MDDECSVLSSCYWDATSITSDGTIPFEFYHTPIGSLLNIPVFTNCSSGSNSRSLTPVFHDMQVSEFVKEELDSEQAEIENTQNERLAPIVSEISSKPPLIKQKISIEENIENKTEKSLKKKSWKRDFAERLSHTKSRIVKSFSIHKSKEESPPSKNIFQSMRHSIRKMRSFNKKSNSNEIIEEYPSKSASAVIKSDCEHFNFVKDTVGTEKTNRSELFPIDSNNDESTPLKPRRQFTQEKYLTGSKDTLNKAYTSLKRKSHMEDDKSLFDICSTVSYVFANKLNEASLSKKEDKFFHKFMGNCVNAFLDVHKIQIEKSLEMINKTVGEHVDLNSQNLDIINKSKKYQITEILGSKGVCIITNVTNEKRYIALKTSSPKNWVFLTGLLQHIEKDVILQLHQEWICFSAQSITNLYIERNFFSPLHTECKLLLDSLLQLVVILYCQTVNNRHLKLNPSNILVVSSDLSIVFVFIESERENTINNDNQLLNLHDCSDKEMGQSYQQSIMKLNKYVDQFLSLPENASHLITASYPLDYLFYLLLKLNKDINVFLSSL